MSTIVNAKETTTFEEWSSWRLKRPEVRQVSPTIAWNWSITLCRRWTSTYFCRASTGTAWKCLNLWRPTSVIANSTKYWTSHWTHSYRLWFSAGTVSASWVWTPFWTSRASTRPCATSTCPKTISTVWRGTPARRSPSCGSKASIYIFDFLWTYAIVTYFDAPIKLLEGRRDEHILIKIRVRWYPWLRRRCWDICRVWEQEWCSEFALGWSGAWIVPAWQIFGSQSASSWNSLHQSFPIYTWGRGWWCPCIPWAARWWYCSFSAVFRRLLGPKWSGSAISERLIPREIVASWLP